MYGVIYTYTNTFRVRDAETFFDAMADHRVEVQRYGDEFELYGLDGNECPGLWPNVNPDEDWFYKQVAAHLATDSVAIFYTFDVDSEAPSYEAYAVAINSHGDTVKIDVNDIARAALTLPRRT